jgi:hypothetical protein
VVVDLERAFVTLGAQVGGRDADAATLDHLMDLRVLLAQECRGPYGQSLSEIALVLRVDGSVQSWSRSDVSNVRIQRKARYATADIFMPSEIWKTGGTLGIREFMLSGATTAIEAILQRAKKQKLEIASEALLGDLQRVALIYLKTSSAVRH